MSQDTRNWDSGDETEKLLDYTVVDGDFDDDYKETAAEMAKTTK